MNPHVPTEAEIEAKAGLRHSMSRNAHQMAMTEESRILLTALLRDEMSHAVTEGIRAALTPEIANQFAMVMVDAIKKQANQKVNEAAGGMVRAALKKIGYFAMAGLIVYWIGGWGALAAIVNWFKPGFLK